VKLIRKILLPIVPIYFGVTWLRNVFYNNGAFKSKSYNFPVICIGNLSVGGTGKTPMTEYLIRLLRDTYKVATLSRGYGRTTKGFQIADNTSSAETIGDEPYQFYKKFENITVAVDSNRQNGILQLQKLNNPGIILLDDAFQHRKVKAGLNILLTPFNKLYVNDICLPTGDLREPKSGSKRADIILVTKCPNEISKSERHNVITKLKPKKNQNVFFSVIDYSRILHSKNDTINFNELRDNKFTLVTGIANSLPLVNHLQNENLTFEHLNFKDHHKYSDEDIEVLKQKEIIVTTEKDFTKLSSKLLENRLYYLPIENKIFEHKKFDDLVLAFCSK